MDIPKIKVIERSRYFYGDDKEKIKKKEGDWANLFVLEDLTFDDDNEGYGKDKIGSVICWNKKDKQIEVLNYDICS